MIAERSAGMIKTIAKITDNTIKIIGLIYFFIFILFLIIFIGLRLNFNITEKRDVVNKKKKLSKKELNHESREKEENLEC